SPSLGVNGGAASCHASGSERSRAEKNNPRQCRGLQEYVVRLGKRFVGSQVDFLPGCCSLSSLAAVGPGEEAPNSPVFSGWILDRRSLRATRPVRKPDVGRRRRPVRNECERDLFLQRRSWHRHPKCPTPHRIDWERRVVRAWLGCFETAEWRVESILWKSAC